MILKRILVGCALIVLSAFAHPDYPDSFLSCLIVVASVFFGILLAEKVLKILLRRIVDEPRLAFRCYGKVSMPHQVVTNGVLPLLKFWSDYNTNAPGDLNEPVQTKSYCSAES